MGTKNLYHPATYPCGQFLPHSRMKNCSQDQADKTPTNEIFVNQENNGFEKMEEKRFPDSYRKQRYKHVRLEIVLHVILLRNA